MCKVHVSSDNLGCPKVQLRTWTVIFLHMHPWLTKKTLQHSALFWIIHNLKLSKIGIFFLLLWTDFYHEWYKVPDPILSFCRHLLKSRMLSWQQYNWGNSYSQNIGVAYETKLHSNNMHLACRNNLLYWGEKYSNPNIKVMDLKCIIYIFISKLNPSNVLRRYDTMWRFELTFSDFTHYTNLKASYYFIPYDTCRSLKFPGINGYMNWILLTANLLNLLY